LVAQYTWNFFYSSNAFIYYSIKVVYLEKRSFMVTVSNRINIENIEITRKQVCRNLGYRDGYKLSVRTASLIDEYIDHAHHLIEPMYAYIIRDIEGFRRSCVFIEGSIVFESSVIARLLEQCRKAAIFIATIGNQLEEAGIRLASEGFVLQSVVLDAIGSVAVDKVAEYIQDMVREIANNQNLAVSRRFSPGYCDWTIRQQKAIFRAVNHNSTGVYLTEEWLMLPRKSISGVIGICPSDLESYNPCETCKKRDCLGRR